MAEWEGNSWKELGSTAPLNANGNIDKLKTGSKGNVYAAGAFTDAIGQAYVAKYKF